MRKTLATLALMLATSPLLAADELPALAIDGDRVAVFGLSSGAYMAQQLHIAYSSRFSGAAMMAGGPFGCAKGDLGTALKQCMNPAAADQPDLAALADAIRDRADAGELDALSGLAGDRVYVFHGRLDQTVGEAITRASGDLYAALDAPVNLQTDYAREVAHTLPTLGEGQCDRSESPWLAPCDFDLAGAAMRHLYDLPDDAEATPAQGEIQSFSQRQALAGELPPGLAEQGYLYVPEACTEGGCGLLVALHGCQQTADLIGTAFVEGSGLRRWADLAKVVVLYPQTAPSMMPLNPKACWDWWGYSGKNYDGRDGAQTRALMRFVDILQAPSR